MDEDQDVQDDGGTPDWPDPELPDGVPRDGDEGAEGDRANQDGNRRGATSAADGDPDPEDDENGEGTPAPDNRQNGRMIPAYRLEQQAQRYERQLADSNRRLQTLERMVNTVLGRSDGRGGDDRPALTPEQQRLRTEFLKLFPEFEQLVALSPKAKDLLGLTERIPSMERDNEQYWQRVATSTTKRLHGEVAKGLGVKTLDQETADIVTDAFIAWVKADRSGERHDRYEGQDPSLVGDFWTFYGARFGRPQQRQQNASAMRRAQGNQQLPRGGNSSTRVPPNQPPKKKPSEDDDPYEAVGSKAWTALQADQDARS